MLQAITALQAITSSATGHHSSTGRRLKRLDFEDVADLVRKSRLRRFGHFERKETETGDQLAEIWLSQEMLERVDQGKGGGMLWRTKKGWEFFKGQFCC